MRLEDQEKEQYSRHLLLTEVGESGQEKLKNTSVLVVGIGGLGCGVAQQLTAIGIGKIGLIDGDMVSMSNLQRQILYNSSEVGQLKVDAAAIKLKLLNPFISIHTYPTFLTKENADEIFSEYDIIVDCTDDISTKNTCNTLSSKLKKPLVYGALYKFEGQVSVFNFSCGPGYLDAFPSLASSPPIDSCSAIGVYAIIPQIIASLQANEVVKIALQKGDILSGKLLNYNALTNQFHIFKYTRK